ncbi:MAG: biotin--[acetyl-CoA-carboxylase] ligase [Ruminococcaceae bacterium]|nr:biotin--[acetyl-CoA-carboxylase] ligase [Oscillospiraceae bacterium]
MQEGSMIGALTAPMIREYLPNHLVCSDLRCLETIDSTNTYLKREAVEGAGHGTVAVADCQSAGRGRMGRSFVSPPGKGVYLSVLLRPALPPEVLMRATGMAAVAMCRAVERVSGARPGIKWTNDLVLNGKKLCGILAETVMQGAETALIIGVGINVSHDREDFGQEVAGIATSLEMEGYPVLRAALVAAMIEELYRLSDALGGDISPWVEEYRRRCVNLGKAVQLLWTEKRERAVALDIDEQFGLVVRRADGNVTSVRTGEVSVRGLYGYVE